MIYRIMEINIEDGSYKVLYGGPKTAEKLEDVVFKYAKENVHEKDKSRFINFFCGYRDKMPMAVNHVYYRRMVDGDWKFSCAEAININEPIMLLVVKDIEDDVKEFFEQLKD